MKDPNYFYEYYRLNPFSPSIKEEIAELLKKQEILNT